MVVFTLSLPKECGLNLSRTDPHVPYFSLFLSFFFKTHWVRILCLGTSLTLCDRFTEIWGWPGSWSFESPKSRNSRWRFRGKRRPHRQSHRSVFAQTMESIAQVNRPKLLVKLWLNGLAAVLVGYHVLSFPTRKCWLQGSLWIWVPWKNLWHLFAYWNGYGCLLYF